MILMFFSYFFCFFKKATNLASVLIASTFAVAGVLPVFTRLSVLYISISLT